MIGFYVFPFHKMFRMDQFVNDRDIWGPDASIGLIIIKFGPTETSYWESSITKKFKNHNLFYNISDFQPWSPQQKNALITL